MSTGGPTGPNREHSGGTNTIEGERSTPARLFDLLADDRRRYVLDELRTASADAVAVEDLVDHLLAFDRTATDPDRVRLALYHKTLPGLADAGVVDFDRRTGVVRYREHELVEDLLDAVADSDPSAVVGADRRGDR